jgi:parallel beta-helix repeat protein
VPAYQFVIEAEPETTITSVTPDIEATNFETTSRSVTFTFTGTGASLLCRLDDEAALFVECPGGVAGQATYTNLAYGEHIFEVMAVGEFGTPDMSPAEFTWMVGTDVAPDVTITEAPPTGTEATAGAFVFGSSDPTAAFRCSLDGAPMIPCSSPWDYTGLLAGEMNPHTFVVEATNATVLESVQLNEATHEWTITDATPPTTVLLAPLPANPSGADVEFRFSGTDSGTLTANLTFECRLDGVDPDPYAPCSSPYAISTLTSGEHTFEVRAVDPTGNTDRTPATYIWTVNLGPETTIDSAPDNPTSSSTATFTFSSITPGAFFQCSLDGAPFERCTSPREYTQLSNGSYRFEVRATTADGLFDETPAFHEWTVDDQTAPETTIDSGPARPTTTSTSAAFSFSADEQPATFECSLDGAAFAPCDSPREYGVGVGEHTFQVQATDMNENTDLTPATWTWTVEDGPQPPATVAAPQPAVVTCGQVLTQSTLVENNLTNCPGEGLVIGASNIIVDLGGHTIDGPDYLLNPPATNETLPAGIRNSGFDNVTIRNGTVQQFGDGALLKEASTSNVVANVTFASNAIAGIHLDNADSGTIRDNRPIGNAAGIFLANGSDGNVATRNTLSGNLNMAVHVVSSSGNRIESNRINGLVSGLPGSDGGVQLDGATNNVVLSNTVTDTGDVGVVLIQGSHDNRIEANTLTRTGDSGIHIQDSNGSQVIGNVAHEAADNGVGLSAANDSLIQGNDVRFNAGGIEVEGASSGNRIEDNLASETTGSGISIAADGLSNTVRLNIASGNGAQGILVDGVAPDGSGSLIEGNRTHANLGGGLRVAGSGHTLTGNVANDNAGWGIFAAAGNTDGGGNTAGGNAEPDQCSGVVCGVSDRTAPQTTITSSPTMPTIDTTAGFSFTSSEANSTFQCSLNGASYARCTSPAQYTGLGVGQHQFRVRAIDPAGNVDGSAASHTWTIDEPPANTPMGSNVPVDLIAPDGTIATVTFFNVATPGRTTIALESASTVPDGYVAAGARFYDINTTAGYTAPVTVCIGYDPAAYTNFVGLLHFAGGAWSDVTTSSDPFGGQVCGVVNSLSPFAIAELTPENSPDTQLFPPEGPILETEPGAAEVHFQFASSDPLATFQCALGGGDWTSCDTPYKVKADVGEHTLLVRAVNEAGTAFDLSPASHTFTVVARPVATIGLGPEDQAPEDPDVQTEIRTATFTFSSNDASATFECRLIGETIGHSWEPCTSPKTYDNLPFDEYTFEVQAINAAGASLFPDDFEWQIGDLTRPNTTIESGPANPTSETRATFVFSATEPATFECWLDGLPSACSSGITITNLDAGSHTFEVLATDVSEQKNVELEPAVYRWTVDLQEPETQIDSKPNAFTPSSSARFEFSGTDNGTAGSALTFRCTLDAQPPAACSSPHELTVEAGTHTLQVQAVDAAGNVDSTSASYTWTVDPTAPTTDITGIRVGSVIIEFAGTDETTPEPELAYECKVDADPFTACVSPQRYALPDGDHTFEVRAIDAAGNIDPTPATYGWTVDTQVPETTIDTQPSAVSTSASASFGFSSDDAGAGFQCALDGAAFTSCSSPQEYSGLAEGAHSFRVRAIDAAENIDQTPADYNWTINTGAPETTIDSKPANPSTSSSASFGFSSDEAGSSFECRLDGAAFSACSSPKAYTGLAAGSHSFEVRATDAGGNVDETPAAYSWTIDTRAPQTTITEKPANPSASASASFGFSSDETGSTFRCSLDGAAYAVCSTPQAYASLADGAHSFRVRAVDAAGNVDSTPATYSWTVDTRAPETTISASPAQSTASTSASFSFVSDDSRATFRCSLDGAAFAACTSPTTYSGLAPRSHTFEVRAVDAAGNVDATPASYTWTVLDTIAPETTITGQPVATTTNTTAGFSFTGSDDVTGPASLTYACSLDGAAFIACTSPTSYSNLTVGSHTFQVRATDAGGNVDATPAAYTWQVQVEADTTVPETTITAEPPATTTQTSASFSFSSSEAPSTFECSIDSAAFAACTSPKSYSGLASGTHTFRVRATDASGNVDATPASFSWNIGGSTVDCGVQQTLTASADAWIDQGSPLSNKGSDSILKVMSKSDGNLRGLVRFDLPTMPEGCSVESATLRFYAASSVGGRTIQVLQLGGSWTEGGVTWQNQPATTGGAVTTSSGSGYREWDVAGQVQAMYSGANNGFLVRDTIEGQAAEQQFHSREKADNRPLLVIKLGSGAPPPPPGSNGEPETQITGNPLAATSSTSATFTFTGTDDATPATSLTFQCQLDVAETSSWTACTSPQSYSGLADGSHTFRVRAVDGTGNVDSSPAVYTWTIDRTAPETVISNGPGSTTTSTSASFAFTSPETGTTFQCSLDSAAFDSCTSPKSYSALTVGSHSFQVRAVDAAGNIDGTPATYPWTIQSGGGTVNCGSAQTMTAVADSWIDQSSSSSNKGSDSILKVMSKSGANLRALVRYNLPSIPAGCVIDTATLRMYAGSASSSQRTLQAFRAGASWTESGVTWANQPAVSGSAVTTMSGSGYREWNVAIIVQNMYSSGSNNGFLIKDATEGQDAEQQFYSREKGTDPPQLVVSFKAAP